VRDCDASIKSNFALLRTPATLTEATHLTEQDLGGAASEGDGDVAR
jgi:hypothetical protein